VQVGRDVRHFNKVRTVDDDLEAQAGWLGQPAAASHSAAAIQVDVGSAPDAPAGTYVDPRIIGMIKAGEGGRWDYTKLLGLLQELEDNYRDGNGYAAHALLRAVLDHVPPLFAQPNFTGVVNNHSWGRTDRSYVKRLAAFRDQADDALHRPINRSPDLLTVEDMPTREAVNSFLRECAARLESGT